MSYDDDYSGEEAYEEVARALYPEHFERAVIEFTTDRLQSFYLAHRDVALAPLSALSKARALLLGSHPEAALVFAGVAVEVGLRAAILQPITYGLVHNEDLAAAVAGFLMETRPPLERLRPLSLRILAEHGGIDLDRDQRPGAIRSLWDEMKWLQRERNKVLHDASSVPSGNAEDAVAIAAHFLEVVFPNVLRWLELALDPDHLISRDTGRRFPDYDYRLDETGRLYGPCAGGQYVLRDEGRIFEGSSDTGFYVSGDHLYGPASLPPWVKACEELTARFKAVRDERLTGAMRDRWREFLHLLFASHALRYEPIEDGPPEVLGIVTTPAGALLVGASYVAWGEPSDAEVRAFEDVARGRGVGGVYFSRSGFDRAASSLEPASRDFPVVLVDGREIGLIVNKVLLLSDVLDQKLAAARDGRMYVPVFPRRLRGQPPR